MIFGGKTEKNFKTVLDDMKKLRNMQIKSDIDLNFPYLKGGGEMDKMKDLRVCKPEKCS